MVDDPVRDPVRTTAATPTTGRVLVVDDEAGLCRILGNLVRGVGHEVELAFDGDEALDKLRTFRPDVVVLDHHMPARTGLEVFETVRRERPDLDHTRFLFYTADSAYNRRIAALEAGADDVLVKPCKANHLLAKINNLVGLAQGLSRREQAHRARALRVIPALTTRNRNLANHSATRMRRTFDRILAQLQTVADALPAEHSARGNLERAARETKAGRQQMEDIRFLLEAMLRGDEQQSIEREAVHLDELVDQVLDAGLQAQLQRRQLTVATRIDDDIRVVVDADLLVSGIRRALYAMIADAPPESRLVISTSRTKQVSFTSLNCTLHGGEALTPTLLEAWHDDPRDDDTDLDMAALQTARFCFERLNINAALTTALRNYPSLQLELPSLLPEAEPSGVEAPRQPAPPLGQPRVAG